MLISDLTAKIRHDYPPRNLEKTDDVIQFGDDTQELKGVAVVFMPTLEVLRKAVNLGANLVITHEPLFYGSDRDETWKESDCVVRAKTTFLTVNNLVVWRFHDGTHNTQFDLIECGLVKKLGWEKQDTQDKSHTYRIAPTPLRVLAERIRRALVIESVRIVGHPSQTCENIGITVGCPSSRKQVTLLANQNVDVLIIGETREWETSEYTRDAIASGQTKGLIILGHANSEEPGVEYVTALIRDFVPENIPVTYLQTGDPFWYSQA